MERCYAREGLRVNKLVIHKLLFKYCDKILNRNKRLEQRIIFHHAFRVMLVYCSWEDMARDMTQTMVVRTSADSCLHGGYHEAENAEMEHGEHLVTYFLQLGPTP